MKERKRSFRYIVILCLAGIIHSSSHAQINTIPRDWKFKTADSSKWAEPGYNDAHWNNMKTGLWWAHAGYDYSGFAWYRKMIFISSKLKPAVQRLGYLKLSLGQIQDADQTFLNGELIGQTGNFSPFEGRWGEPRVYFVKADQIKWDAPNIIAVRVYGPNQNGGMHTGPYTYEPYKISFKDYISVREKKPENEEKADLGQKLFEVVFNNKSKERYTGMLTFYVKDISNKVITTEKKEVIIKSGNDNTYPFNYVIPKEGIYYLSSVFKETQSGGTLEKEVIVSTIKKVELPVSKQPSVVIQDKVKDAFVSAPFENQKIGGLIGNRMDINLTKRLLQVDEQELLAGYLDRPGRQNWVGEHIGKYLETACNTWRYTHDTALKVQMDRMLFVLLHTQLPNGYLGTYTPENYWTNWDVWSHKYNLIGLLAYYNTTGYTPAFDAAKRIGDLLCKTFGDKPGQMDIVLSGTHVGMASTSVLNAIVDLYRYTGDKKYLDFAHYIIRSYNEPDGPKIVKTLLEVGKVNEVANGKAYEMLSNLLGIIKLYKITGEEALLKAVQIAWNDIVQNRLYITGTSSSYELFRGNDVLPAGEEAHMGEGCVTVTWIRFNYELFTLTGSLKYLDQIEKSTYNHLLGAENPLTGCVSYYTSLQDKKPYSCGITCCLSSVPRGISMIPLFNYGKRFGVPTVLLYESEQIKDSVKSKSGAVVPFTLQAVSSFPDKGKIIYTISPAQNSSFPLAIRVPQWSTRFTAKVDGKQYSGTADQFITIDREWKKGDQVEVDFDIPVKIIPGGKSYPNRVAIQRGPQVLSVDSSLNKSLSPFVSIVSISNPSNLILQTNDSWIPANWIGKQVYAINVPVSGGGLKRMLLVPFADASQTGAKAEVWISVAKENKE